MAEYSLDELMTICKEIQRRVKGGMSDEEFTTFVKMIRPPSGECKYCESTGVYLDRNAMVVCRECDYHRLRGRKLSIRKPESVK